MSQAPDMFSASAEPGPDYEDPYCETVPLPKAIAEHPPRCHRGQEARKARARDLASAGLDKTVSCQTTGQAADRFVLAGCPSNPADREREPAEPSRAVRPKTIVLTHALTRAPRTASSQPAPNHPASRPTRAPRSLHALCLPSQRPGLSAACSWAAGAAHNEIMRKPRTATTLLLNGPSGLTWSILTADGVVFNVQFDDPPVITRRAVSAYIDQRPRGLTAFEASTGEPLRYTVSGHRGSTAAVVVSISRTGSICGRCGERRVLRACVRCAIDPTHFHADTKYVGKHQSRRRRLVNSLDPALRILDGFLDGQRPHAD